MIIFVQPVSGVFDLRAYYAFATEFILFIIYHNEAVCNVCLLPAAQNQITDNVKNTHKSV